MATIIGQSGALPPGPSGLPFFGSALAFNRDPLGFLTTAQRRFGDVITATLFKYRFFAFFSPRAVKHILVDKARNFTNREANYDLRTLLGDGLLTIDGAEHKQQRRIVQPAFHKSRIDSYADTMLGRTGAMLERWGEGEELDLAEEMRQLTLGIAAATLFGVDLTEEGIAIGQALRNSAEYTDLPPYSPARLAIDLPYTPYGRFLQARRLLDETINRIIARRRGQGEREDVLSMLLAATDENGGFLSDRQVRDHLLTFLAAGHATTSNLLTWTVYLLSQHPAVEKQLREELERVLGGRESTVADLPELPYLEMVINESLRLYPPAWAQIRRATEAFELDGYRIPAGGLVIVSQWVTHRRPDLWAQPERFIPERWTHPSEPPPLSYFPFGGGPRTCIGMPFALLEAKLVLATILQRFHAELAPGFRVVPRALIILQPRDGLRVRLSRVQARATVAV